VQSAAGYPSVASHLAALSRSQDLFLLIAGHKEVATAVAAIWKRPAADYKEKFLEMFPRKDQVEHAASAVIQALYDYSVKFAFYGVQALEWFETEEQRAHLAEQQRKYEELAKRTQNEIDQARTHLGPDVDVQQAAIEVDTVTKMARYYAAKIDELPKLDNAGDGSWGSLSKGNRVEAVKKALFELLKGIFIQYPPVIATAFANAVVDAASTRWTLRERKSG
jgi:hypothetical protein